MKAIRLPDARTRQSLHLGALMAVSGASHGPRPNPRSFLRTCLGLHPQASGAMSARPEWPTNVSTKSSLSPDRAFVVQLRKDDSCGSAKLEGRVEHVTSGTSAEFGSLTELAEFMQQTVGPGAAGSRTTENGKSGWLE